MEEEIHDTVPDAAPFLCSGSSRDPEDVMDDTPSKDEVDGASSASGVDPFDVAREETLEMVPI